MPTAKLTSTILNAAILGMEVQREKLDAQIAEIRQMLDGNPTAAPAATPEAPTRKRKKFSAPARRRMKEAQQRRWAKIRGESAPPAPATPEPAKPKRKLSAKGRRAIADASRKRWAAVRLAKAQQEKAGRKKFAVKKPKKAAVKKAAPATAQAAG